MKTLDRFTPESSEEFSMRVKNFTDNGWRLVQKTDWAAWLEKESSITEKNLRVEFEQLEKKRQALRDEMEKVVSRQIAIWQYCSDHPEVFFVPEKTESEK
jgi:hypothetical protein